MKVWILQKECLEYGCGGYVEILGVYNDELEALRELNSITDKFDIEVVGYEIGRIKND